MAQRIATPEMTQLWRMLARPDGWLQGPLALKVGLVFASKHRDIGCGGSGHDVRLGFNLKNAKAILCLPTGLIWPP